MTITATTTPGKSLLTPPTLSLPSEVPSRTSPAQTRASDSLPVWPAKNVRKTSAVAS